MKKELQLYLKPILVSHASCRLGTDMGFLEFVPLVISLPIPLRYRGGISRICSPSYSLAYCRLGTEVGFREYVPLGFSLASCCLGTDMRFLKFVPPGY